MGAGGLSRHGVKQVIDQHRHMDVFAHEVGALIAQSIHSQGGPDGVQRPSTVQGLAWLRGVREQC